MCRAPLSNFFSIFLSRAYIPSSQTAKIGQLPVCACMCAVPPNSCAGVWVRFSPSTQDLSGLSSYAKSGYGRLRRLLHTRDALIRLLETLSRPPRLRAHTDTHTHRHTDTPGHTQAGDEGEEDTLGLDLSLGRLLTILTQLYRARN
jgi:hypothetical protein